MKSAKNWFTRNLFPNKKKICLVGRGPPQKKSGWGVRRDSSRPPGADFFNSGTPKTQESALPET